MKYDTHSWNSEDIKIKIIENGFIITYQELLRYKEKYVANLEELFNFLKMYYREKND